MIAEYLWELCFVPRYSPSTGASSFVSRLVWLNLTQVPRFASREEYKLKRSSLIKII